MQIYTFSQNKHPKMTPISKKSQKIHKKIINLPPKSPKDVTLITGGAAPGNTSILLLCSPAGVESQIFSSHTYHI